MVEHAAGTADGVQQTAAPARLRRRLRRTTWQSIGLVRAVPQERGLTDARLASDDERPAVTGPRVREQVIQHLPFVFAAHQERRLFATLRNLCRNRTLPDTVGRTVLGATVPGR